MIKYDNLLHANKLQITPHQSWFGFNRCFKLFQLWRIIMWRIVTLLSKQCNLPKLSIQFCACALNTREQH